MCAIGGLGLTRMRSRALTFGQKKHCKLLEKRNYSSPQAQAASLFYTPLRKKRTCQQTAYPDFGDADTVF